MDNIIIILDIIYGCLNGVSRWFDWLQWYSEFTLIHDFSLFYISFSVILFFSFLFQVIVVSKRMSEHAAATMCVITGLQQFVWLIKFSFLSRICSQMPFRTYATCAYSRCSSRIVSVHFVCHATSPPSSIPHCVPCLPLICLHILSISRLPSNWMLQCSNANKHCH